MTPDIDRSSGPGVPTTRWGIGLGGLVGMSFGWWVGKHNRHHANPNVEGADPDIDIAPLAFTPAQGRATQGFLRWMAKHQASLFFPLLFLEGFDLHWSGDQGRAAGVGCAPAGSRRRC